MPFILDDPLNIVENPTIHHLSQIWNVLSPPHTAALGGRPIENLSLAINYAFGPSAVWGYHALNLAIHILASLTLLGVVRRTLLRPVLNGRFGNSAPCLALAIAVIWAVHPLQTEAVTYLSERTESLMGLFYLLMLYCFIRGAESKEPRLWFTLCVVACLLGMATKETMVTAPVMVLLYDRTFVAGSFREAWRQRWRLYAGLAGTWLLLGYLLSGLSQRGGVGLGLEVGWWVYGLTQCRSIVHYLRLAVWPQPLIFDYGDSGMMDVLIEHPADAAPYALILLLLLAGVVVGLRRRPVVGFIGAWFFVILAPTSSVVPVAGQPTAEHRMYLPLVAVVVLVVIGVHRLVGRRSLVLFLAAALGLGFLTAQRNEDYRSEASIWSDTAAKRPHNLRALNNLGVALANAGRVTEAMARYRQTLQIDPHYAEAHVNLGAALFNMGNVPEAMQHYEEAIRSKPDYPESYYNLGNALGKLGRVKEARERYEQALRLRPDYANAHNELGLLLVESGRIPEAITHFQLALRFKPDYPDAHYNLGTTLLHAGRLPEALAQLGRAVRLNPDDPNARCNLGIALFQLGRLQQAIEQFQVVLRLQPDYPDAHFNLGNVFAEAGKRAEAKEQYQLALRLKPDDTEARDNLNKLQASP